MPRNREEADLFFCSVTSLQKCETRTQNSRISSTPGSNCAQRSPGKGTTTRSPLEVQDSDADHFAAKLQNVFRECRRILKDDGLLVFTYHHSRDEGWKALADAVLGAGFTVVNSQPVKAEMSVATPKSQAKEPIQLDIIIVCRKEGMAESHQPSVNQAIESAKVKLRGCDRAGARDYAAFLGFFFLEPS